MSSRVPARLAIPAIALLILLSLSVSLAAAGPPNGHGKAKGQIEATSTFNPERIIIKLKANVADSAVASFHANHGGKGKGILKKLGNLEIVDLPKGKKVQDAIAEYEQSGLVEYAEPDYVVQAFAVPNDTYYADYQWEMNNTGQNGGTPGVDISAEAAWDIIHDAPDVIVAVIDTGVDYTHPDLAANMWTNPGEIPGNSVDDDSDGYIDDVHGINSITGSGDPMDDYGHGTHCSGIIGAVGNNETGICGVAWSVQIMGLKFLDAGGRGYQSNAVLCIEYARSHGAQIISNSWGYYYYLRSLCEAVQAIQDPNGDGDSSDGIAFVCAAGNGDQNGNPFDNDGTFRAHPASFQWANVVTVTSTDSNDDKVYYANYGRWSVDIGAPGLDIISTIPEYWTTPSDPPNDPFYDRWEGTSMAAPHVAGALALLKAERPEESIYHAILRMYGGVEHVTALEDITQTEGRLNLEGALTYEPSVRYDVTPGDPFVASGGQAGPFRPYAISYVITNFTDEVLDWQAWKDQGSSWITLSDTSGLIPPHGSAIVNVTFNSATAALAPGVYTDAVVFIENGYEPENISRPVTLTVGTMHVKTDGDDQLDGLTWATAKATFSSAITTARENGLRTIWVKKGTYTEGVGLWQYDNELQFYGGFNGSETTLAQRPAFPRAKPDLNATIMESGGTAFNMWDVDGVRIDGFTMRNGASSAIYCSNFTIIPFGQNIHPRPTIVNNTFIGNWGWGGGAIYCETGQPTITNNVFDGNYAYDGGAIYLQETDSSTLVASNVFYGNGAIGADSGGGAIHMSDANGLIVNNTFAGNTASPGNGGAIYIDGGSPSVVNNVIAYNSSGVRTSDDGITFRNNDVYGNEAYNFLFTGGTWNPTGTNGNISSDPKLASTTYGNLHIQNNSPCKNTGDNAYVYAGAKDMDGQARIQSTTVDMGADESNGTTWPTTPPVIIRVTPTGNDNYNGLSWGAAKRTIQAAINTVAEKGGEVWVKQGTYKERITLRSLVHIYGGFYGSESTRAQSIWPYYPTVVDGDGGGAVVTAMNGCTPSTLSDLVLVNGTGNMVGGNPYGGGIYCKQAAPAILNCSVVGNSAYQGGGIYIESATPTVANNRIASNSAYYGGGVYAVYSNALFANNTVVGNYATDGGGLYLYSDPVVRAYNNIVAFNSDGVSGGGTSPVLFNNDVYGNTAFNYNPGLGWDPTGTNGNIAVDPKLADLAHGNVHIAYDSPCRNVGANSVVKSDWRDIDREARIDDATVDIGADEYFDNTYVMPPFTYFVTPTGNDANNGRYWAGAKRTIQAAISAAAANGGEVWVKAGTYNERITLSPYVYVYGGFYGNEGNRDARNWMTNESIIDGQSGGSVVSAIGGQNVSAIDGFTIRNGAGTSRYGTFYGGGIYSYMASPSIANNKVTQNSAQYGAGIYFSCKSPSSIVRNVITGNSYSAYSYGTGIYLDQSNLLIDANTISDNNGGYYSYGIGIYLNQTQATITNNVITGNQSVRGYGGGIYSDGNNAPNIVNNTIVGNNVYDPDYDGTGGGIYLASGGLVQNNIIASNVGGYGIYTYGSPSLVNNDVWSNTPWNYYGVSPGANDMSQNPVFLDAGNSNYRLGSSPCLDMGEDVGAPDHDRDGGNRPNPDHPWSRDTDLGAYESGASTGAFSAYAPDGTVVQIAGVLVSAQFPQWGRIYVQRMDRVSGIRVDTPCIYTIGHTLTIRGTMQTDATLGERYIQPLPGYPFITSGNNVYSLGMNNLWAGETGVNTRPLTDGTIPFCSAGLLTKTWGRVTNVYPAVNYFTITDGSNEIYYGGANADVYAVSVNVLLPTGGTMPAVGDFLKVTGINGNIMLGAGRGQGLKPRNQNDIVPVTSWTSSEVSGLATGANMLSLPGIPRYPNPESVFYGCTGGPGIQLTWYLQRWVPSSQNWLYYGYCGEAPWGNCIIGEGYLLTIPSDGNHCYVYDRTPVTGDQILYLPVGSNPQQKLEFVGNPFDEPVAWNAVKVSDGVTLKDLSQAMSSGWIYDVKKWTGAAWQSVNISTENMEARKGYLVYPSRSGLAMQVWEP